MRSTSRSAQRRGDRIAVRDNGVGISQKRLATIFELFSQNDPSPDRVHGGLGVGLTLARRLVDMHSGTLVAVSDGAGRGSEFRLSLPRTAAAATQSVAPAAGSVAEPPSALEFSSSTTIWTPPALCGASST